MAFIKLEGVMATPELTYVPDGEDRTVRLLKVTPGTDKNGNPYIMPLFEVVGDANAKNFSHFIGLPADGDEEKEARQKKLNFKHFCAAFGINGDEGFDTEQVKGLTAAATLGISGEEGDQYGIQNKIRQWIERR